MPQVARVPDLRDRLGHMFARIGFTRNNYRVTPGLYAVGNPDKSSPVLVTANYKLSFDALRFALRGMDGWLLVADTRGINVWCAAGKGTFSTEEVLTVIRESRLDLIAPGATLILPQLSATGVCGREVSRSSGFPVRFGPVRVGDIPAFVASGGRADERMRSVTFTLAERAALIPVELYLKFLPLLLLVPLAFMLSGIGPHFSFQAAWSRGRLFWAATVLGLVGGSVLMPLLLPWLPGRSFWLKGVWPAAGLSALLATQLAASPWQEVLALVLWLFAVASYQAMSFTGSTPFTSPSGVEHEMRRGIPFQACAALAAIILWLTVPFLGK